MLGNGEPGKLRVQLENGDIKEQGSEHFVPYNASKHDKMMGKQTEERLADTSISDYYVTRAEDQAGKDVVDLIASESEDEYRDNNPLSHFRMDVEMEEEPQTSETSSTLTEEEQLLHDVASYKKSEHMTPVVDSLKDSKKQWKEKIKSLKTVMKPIKTKEKEISKELTKLMEKHGFKKGKKQMSREEFDSYDPNKEKEDDPNKEKEEDKNFCHQKVPKPTRHGYRFILIHRSNLFPVYKDILKKYVTECADARRNCGSEYYDKFDKCKAAVEEEKKKSCAAAWYVISERSFEEFQKTDNNFFHLKRKFMLCDEEAPSPTANLSRETAIDVDENVSNEKAKYIRNHRFEDDGSCFNVTYGDQLISPELKKIMNNKHAVDALDLIKLKTMIYKKHNMNNQNVCSRIQDFENNCYFADESNMSANGAKILQWARENMDRVVYNEKSDHSYSIFANRIIRLLHWYEQALFVANAHSSVLLLQHVKYDAYRQETDLHFNVMTTGAGATSKTFTFEIVRNTCIAGTVSELTFQTTKADAIDGDRNDCITIFNESPPGLFMTDKKDENSEAEAMMKEKLTSQTVTCKEFYRDPDTLLRCNRESKSQSIGVYMGATNDKKSMCKEAMSTRFLWKEYEKFEKGEHSNSIQEMMQRQRDYEKHTNCNGVKDICMYYHRVEHFRVFVVWKYIYAELLPRPNLTAADLVYGKVSVEMKKNGISIPERTKERFDILCRTHVIIHALESNFNVEGGTHACTCRKHKFKYEGAASNMMGGILFPERCKRVELGNVIHPGSFEICMKNQSGKKIRTKVPEKITYDQWVCYMKSRYTPNDEKDSEGVAYFKGEKYGNLTFEETHVDRNKKQCIACWKMDPQNGCNKCFFLYDVMDIKNSLYCTEEIALFALTQIEEELYNVNSYKVKKALWNLFLQNLHYKKQEVSTQLDYNYARFGRTNSLIISIQNCMDAKHGRMSENNIEALLKQWSKTTVKSKPYYPHFRHKEDKTQTDSPLSVITKDYFKMENVDFIVDKTKIPDTEDEYEKVGKRGPKNNTYTSVTLPNGSSTLKDMKLCFKEEKHTYFHMSIFHDIRYEDYVCPITSSIQKSMMFDARYPKKMLLGKCERKDGIITNPRFLDHVEIPQGGTDFEYINSKYITEEQAKMNRKADPTFRRNVDQKEKKCLMDMDVDIYAMNEHVMAQNDYETVRADLGLEEEEMNDGEQRLPRMNIEYRNCDVQLIVNSLSIDNVILDEPKHPDPEGKEEYKNIEDEDERKKAKKKYDKKMELYRVKMERWEYNKPKHPDPEGKKEYENIEDEDEREKAKKEYDKKMKLYRVEMERWKYNKPRERYKRAKTKIPAIMDRDQVWYPHDLMKKETQRLTAREREEREKKKKRLGDALMKPMEKRLRRR